MQPRQTEKGAGGINNLGKGNVHIPKRILLDNFFAWRSNVNVNFGFDYQGTQTVQLWYPEVFKGAILVV